MDDVNGTRPGEEDKKGPNLVQRIGRHVQSKTMSGLIELVPLLVTILVLSFIVRNADKFIRPLILVSGQPWDFPGIGLIAAIVVFYLVGLLISTTLDRQVIIWKGALLSRIPVVKTVFGVTQQSMASMTSHYRFTRVVFLEWPRDGMIAMGKE